MNLLAWIFYQSHHDEEEEHWPTTTTSKPTELSKTNVFFRITWPACLRNIKLDQIKQCCMMGRITKPRALFMCDSNETKEGLGSI